MPRQMKAYQPKISPAQLSEQEFARLARENPEKLFRRYSQSLARYLSIPHGRIIPEELFRRYRLFRKNYSEGTSYSGRIIPKVQSIIDKIFIHTSRQPVAKERDFMRTMLTGESKFGTYMKIGERPMFHQRYYKPQPK